MEKLVEASAAEAEAFNAVWQAAKASSSVPYTDATSEDNTGTSEDNTSSDQAGDKMPTSETSSNGSETDNLERDVRLHPRAVSCFLLYFICLFTSNYCCVLVMCEMKHNLSYLTVDFLSNG